MLAFWFTLTGLLLVGVALSHAVLKRLPLTTSMLYLGVGVSLAAAGVLEVDLVARATLVEMASEIAVIVSLFVAGLKLRLPLTDPRWRVPFRLAFGAMLLTVGAVALVGVYGLGLSAGAAVLLGGLLAPTDPVLASDVQVHDAGDRDRLRFGLTGEASLNDGTAFPFVMLGLGLLGYHELGPFDLRWLGVDVVWAITAGLAIGGGLGTLVARLVLYFRRRHRESTGLDDFLALGLIALAYGLALVVHAYGFLAVFAAGLALRRVERVEHAGTPPEVAAARAERAGGDRAAADGGATDDAAAPAHLAAEALKFNEQLERIGELALVLIAGAALYAADVPRAAVWFIPLLFLVIRPFSVLVGLVGARLGSGQRLLTSWFGIRGIGSVYYLAYALHHGLGGAEAERVTGLVLATVAASVVVHGISVTPLMSLYERRANGRRAARAGTSEAALSPAGATVA